ncbi:aminotransferase class I/II-fold pyridoxal phosphate-dependent enzyme [Desulfobacterota bacterium M19]
MNNKFSFLRRALNKRRNAGQFRTLKPVEPGGIATLMVNGRELLNFSSNDYLGLTQRPEIKEGAISYLRRFGAGCGASRLVCGNFTFFEALEERLARLKGQESALLFNSGFQANVSIIAALANRHALIVADRLCHNSIIQGAILSRARLLRFNHNDYDHLRIIMQGSPAPRGPILIITESVFSMDGDQANLTKLHEIAEEYGAILYVDEAHATGVFGPSGMGLACNGKKADLVMGTFGKGCGSFGAYLACPRLVREYLINYGQGFIYSTALPPAAAGAVAAALDLLPGLDNERRYLQESAHYLRKELHNLGFSTGSSTSQIIPLYTGAAGRALELSNYLEEQGIIGVAIRPPTVEPGQERIRLALSTLHTRNHLDRLLEALASRA